MRKILVTLFIISLFVWNTHATQVVTIIPRADWWANEEYRHWHSSYWSDIFVKRANARAASNARWASYSAEKKASLTASSNIRKAKTAKMNAYLEKNFLEDVKLIGFQRFDWEDKLAWAYGRTKYVKNIVVHHTAHNYESSSSWIKSIHKFHALSRQWWDIWYNYIIWYNWEIYEWRAWGDYVIWSHDTWNNRSTVWISLMWDYNATDINTAQYESLRWLVWHLTKKYWIDLNTKIPYHKECFWDTCTQPLKTTYYYPIVGHRDWKATTCPWDSVYEKIIPKLIKELQPVTKGFKKVSYWESLEKTKQFEAILSSYDWDSVRKKFWSLPSSQQAIFKTQVKELSNKTIWWKKQLVYKRFLQEVQ